MKSRISIAEDYLDKASRNDLDNMESLSKDTSHLMVGEILPAMKMFSARSSIISFSYTSRSGTRPLPKTDSIFNHLVWRKELELKKELDAGETQVVDISPLGLEFSQSVFHSDQINPPSIAHNVAKAPSVRFDYLADSNGKASDWDANYQKANLKTPMKQMEFSQRPSTARRGLQSAYISDSLPEYALPMHLPNQDEIALSTFSGVKPERKNSSIPINFVYDYANPLKRKQRPQTANVYSSCKSRTPSQPHLISQTKSNFSTITNLPKINESNYLNLMLPAHKLVKKKEIGRARPKTAPTTSETRSYNELLRCAIQPCQAFFEKEKMKPLKFWEQDDR